MANLANKADISNRRPMPHAPTGIFATWAPEKEGVNSGHVWWHVVQKKPWPIELVLTWDWIGGVGWGIEDICNAKTWEINGTLEELETIVLAYLLTGEWPDAQSKKS